MHFLSSKDPIKETAIERVSCITYLSWTNAFECLVHLNLDVYSDVFLEVTNYRTFKLLLCKSKANKMTNQPAQTVWLKHWTSVKPGQTKTGCWKCATGGLWDESSKAPLNKIGLCDDKRRNEAKIQWICKSFKL